jgi:hypothetical protein
MALFGRLGVLVVRTQLGFFSAPRLTKCGVVQKLPILGNTDEQIPAAHEGGV